MRPVEILLILANLVAFIVLALPRLQKMGWLPNALLAALITAITQIIVEGPRWQMFPSYALAIISSSYGC